MPACQTEGLNHSSPGQRPRKVYLVNTTTDENASLPGTWSQEFELGIGYESHGGWSGQGVDPFHGIGQPINLPWPTYPAYSQEHVKETSLPRNLPRPNHGLAEDLLGVIQRIMKTSASKVFVAVIVGWIISQAACSRSPSHGMRVSSAGTVRPALTADEAAQLAARLANDQCEGQYHKRPFVAEQYAAMLQDSRYRWGGLDVGGRGGYSALVTFRRDGSEPYVEVYYSTDVLP